jgi:hypothetical protein
MGALADHLQDVYLHNKTGKDMCDAVNNDCGEQYHDYKMVDGKGMIEQAHEI